MQDTEVYIKTDAGRDEIRSRTLGLPMSVRAILLMVDGQRSVSTMRTLIAGSKAPADVLDGLFAQGLIQPLSGPSSTPTAAPAAPIAAVPVPVVAAARLAPVSHDAPLDLVLPTLHAPVPAADGPSKAVAAAPVALDRYEHLYTMMNEIVRDFLAPHRRYFLQLKIERCGTPEELLELLHDVQTALAKARGEAFASDVISRLRNAAG